MRERGVEFEAVNYAKTGLDAATVKTIVAAAGGVAAVLNTRHAVVKEKGWKDNPPSVADFAAAVVKDVNLLKRPILIEGKKVIVGFDQAAYGKL